MDKKLMIKLSALFGIFCIFWGVAYASYTIWSNTATTQVGDYSLVLSSPANAPLNSNITLTATLLDNGAPLSGQNITFYADLGSMQSVGTDITDASGIATVQYNVTTQGARSFQASYLIP